MAEVFISYAREDQGFARDLHTALQRVNRDTWIDWRSIPDSAKWRAEIFTAIEAADNFLFVISPDSVKSWMCGQEVSHAVANNKRLITVLYHSVESKELLPALAEIQWIDYPELGFEQTFQRLTTTIDTDLNWVRKHTQFLVRATEWESKNGDQGFLLHGMELKEAVRWLEQAAAIKDRKPTELQEQYIRASEEWEAGEIKRLTDLSRIAVVRELVAFSTLSLEDDPERGIILALYAVDATRSVDGAVVPEAEDALHRATLKSSIRFIRGQPTPAARTAVIEDLRPAIHQAVKGWDVASRRELQTFVGHSSAVSAVAATPDGRLAVSASGDRTLRVWELGSGRVLRALTGHISYVNGVAISEDGRLAVSASADKTLKVWEVESGRGLRSLESHLGPVLGVAMSEDGRLAVSASDDKTLKVWELETGRELRTLVGHTSSVYEVALSGDGRLAVSASLDKTLKVWDVESGRSLRALTGHSDSVYSVALSGDGQLAVSGSEDKTVRVWDVDSGRELITLNGHSTRVNGTVISPDGRRVASASDDKTVRIWDTKNGRELITLAGHDGAVNSVTWTADGKRLLSGGADGIIQVYAMDIDLLMSLARSRVTRNLTPEQCRKYLHRDDVPPIP